MVAPRQFSNSLVPVLSLQILQSETVGKKVKDSEGQREGRQRTAKDNDPDFQLDSLCPDLPDIIWPF
jgi:hypothetical protein